MEFRSYHKDLSALHVGTEEPRAYYIPYDSEISAQKADRNESAYFMNLCGEWDFRFYETFEDLESTFPNEPVSGTMTVPFCWQMRPDEKRDAPLYSNLKYPFPLDPPHVPQENPCGHYRRTFHVTDAQLLREIYLNFEGVSSCFYLFVNGSFVGYSQVSHCMSEFDVSPFLHSGENTLDVLVVKWCDGSYLEDQDYFRLSGIFREVYLLFRSKNHIRDIYIRQEVSEDFGSASLKLEADCAVNGNFSLINADGNIVSTGELEDGNGAITLQNPTLWNPEVPYVYTLLLQCADEWIPFPIALRRIDVKNAVIYINGVKVKAYGINRHDSNPETGYALTLEQMKQDLVLLKQASCNCIRTSHYPNDPRFPEMAQSMGFMLVDEADLETHGMGFEYRDTWDWMRWSMLSTEDEWEESYVDRARLLFERDKNYGCVIMWSLGNESGCGKNHRSMRNYIKSRDAKALVHYENAHLEFKAVPVGECFVDISDVESRMYSALSYTEEYLKNRPKKPFFFCEYVCSLTTGDIPAHVQLVDKYDQCFGACVWEYCDHAVQITKPDGTVAFRYGGDFDASTGDTTGCIDGMVFPDRTPRPGYFDMKQAYVPFSVRSENGSFYLYNRRFYTDLSDTYLCWKITCDGKSIATGKSAPLSVAPRTEQKMDLSLPVLPDGECFLTFFMYTAEDCVWADKDFLLGFCQIPLSEIKAQKATASVAPKCEKNGRFYRIECRNASYEFDCAFGRLSKIEVGGKNLLTEPTHIELWKAHAYNQDAIAEEKRSASMEKIVQQTYDCVCTQSPENVTITCNVSFGGASVVPVLRGTLEYIFTDDGAVQMHITAQKRDLAPTLPRLAFAFSLKPGFEQMTYYGYGPLEAYPDRHKACYIDRFESTVKDNFVPYIRPFENGAHYDSRFGEIRNEEGTGLRFSMVDKTFLFNATHFTPNMLESALHVDELVPSESTFVYVDAGMDIVGQKEGFEKIEPERFWDDRNIDFSIRMEPIQ